MGISRMALYAALGEVTVVEPILIAAYEREAEREWREGRRPKTSFYISDFPGTNELACGRQAIYGLMNVPEPKPREPRLSAMFDQGKDIEMNLVQRLAADGVILSGNEAEGESQTKFVDPDVWASGSADAIVLPAFWRKGHVCEIKTTSADKVSSMRADPNATPFSHSKYLRQIKTYIGLAHELPFAPTVTVCSESWALTTQVGNRHWCPIHQSLFCEVQTIKLEPPDDGTLIYSSREEPLTTASYYVTYDPEHLRAGREKLAEWRDAFLAGELPPHVRGEGKPRWSEDPCRFCAMKKDGCRPDEKEGVTRIADSHAIKAARKIRPGYDYAVTRRSVLERWGAEDLAEQAVVA